MPDSPLSSSGWAAPVATHPVKATIHVPGSKSVTARALYLAAIAGEPTCINGALESRDSSLMCQALRALGARIDTHDNGVLEVSPIEGFSDEEITIHTGLAGTVMRFIPLLAALRPGVTHVVGDAQAEERPLAPLTDLLSQLGAEVTFHAKPGFVPFTLRGIHPDATLPTLLRVDASASSQFLSAALLVAPLLGLRDGRPRRIEATDKVVSLPHIEMTCEALRQRGIRVDFSPATHDARATWVVYPGRPDGGHISVEPDLTNAGAFLAACALCGGQVTIPDWPLTTTQAGDAWRDFFTRLGACFTLDDDGLHMEMPATASTDDSGDAPPQRWPRFPGVTMDFSAIGELTPTAVAVLLFADSPSLITGVAHIRGHETDRLAALAAEIGSLGGAVRELPDGLEITPVPLQGEAMRAYADHRMATFAAIVGLRVPGVTVDDIAATSKTLPSFPQLWADMLGSDSTQEVSRGTA